MGVARRLRAEGAKQEQLAGRVGEVIVTSDHVGDAHVAIVHDGGEVVAGDAVGAHDDEVPDGGVADRDGSAHEVVDHDVSVRHQEAHGGPLPGLETTPYLCRLKAEAAAVVARRAVLAQGDPAQLLEALLAAEAVVGGAARQELAGRQAVALEALALPVRRARAADVRTLVPLQAHPAQVLEDGGFVPLLRAHSIGVVDAHHEVTLRVPGEEIVEQGRTRRADVQRACRARREAHSHLGPEVDAASMVPAFVLQNAFSVSPQWRRAA